MPELFRLKKPLGPNYVVDPDDVVRTKSALAGLGFFEPPEEGITPWPDRPMIDAVVDLQRAGGLEPAGVVNPGGPTQQAINHSLAARRNLQGPSNGGTRATRTGENATGPMTPARWDEINKRLEEGAQRITAPIRKKVAKDRFLWFDPEHGARPIHTMLAQGNAEVWSTPPLRARGADAEKPAGPPNEVEQLAFDAWDRRFERIGNTKEMVVIDRPKGGWLSRLFGNSDPLILRPEIAQLVVDIGEYSDRNQGLTPREERTLHLRTVRLFKGNPDGLRRFAKSIRP